MACTQLVINMRYGLMSLSMSQKADDSLRGIHRWLVGFGITDEIFIVSSGSKEKLTPQYMYGLILLPFVGWSLGTFLGAVAGAVLPQIVTASLGIAIYGMFLAIIIPPAKKDKAVMIVAACAAVMSCALKWLPVLKKIPSGFSIIICALACSALGALIFPVSDGKNGGGKEACGK